MCLTLCVYVCVCGALRPPLEIKLSTQSWITCVLFMIFHAAITRCFPSISFYCHFYSTCYCCGLFRIAASECCFDSDSISLSSALSFSVSLSRLTIFQHFCLNFPVLKLFNVQLFFCQLATFNCSEKYCQQKSEERKRKMRKYCQLL